MWRAFGVQNNEAPNHFNRKLHTLIMNTGCTSPYSVGSHKLNIDAIKLLLNRKDKHIICNFIDISYHDTTQGLWRPMGLNV